MSSTLSSLLWPMPTITGRGKFATFSARLSVSKPDKSLVAPPPLIITTTSNSSALEYISFRAAITLRSVASPCITAGNSLTVKASPLPLSCSWLQKSSYPAALSLDTTATRCVKSGSTSSFCSSRTPSSFRRAIISRRLRAMSPSVYSGFMSVTIHEKP
ncbi:unknown [Prevotella sp. CAG:487]|nr:unknown [Prevotella sp. CAG:487]